MNSLPNISYGLAPMEGVTEFPTRLWYSMTSAPDFQCSPFLRVTDSYPADLETIESKWPELTAQPDALSYQFNPQMMASDPERFIEAAQQALKKTEFIEINCGCPAPKVVGNGAGSSLLISPNKFIKTIEHIASRLGPDRFAVKMRTGFNTDEDYQTMVDGIAELKLRHLCVHGRTRKERYQGKANWQQIIYAANTVKYPVIGSGDICSRNSMPLESLHPNLRTFIIGRGALRNPWIFEELRTDKNVSVSPKCVIFSLACYTLLHFLYSTERHRLAELMQTGLCKDKLGVDEDRWQEVYEKLCLFCSDTYVAPEKLAVPPVVLGRLKLLWKNLRTGLGPELMEPSVLRIKEAGLFFEAIKKICPESMRLDHREEYDWIFAGTPKKT